MCHWKPTSSQEGSATTVMVGLCFVTVLFFGVLVMIWQVYAAKQQVQYVAELSALTAVDASRGLVNAQACKVAGEIASAHAMELESCEVSGDLLDIVTVRIRHVKGISLQLHAKARAGSSYYLENMR